MGGKTLAQARQAIQEGLSIGYATQRFDLSYYEYYMVRVSGDQTRKLVRVPLRDGIKVKEALKGAPPLDNKLIWIAQTGGDKPRKEELLRVDWKAISHGDSDATNYALPSRRLSVCRRSAEHVQQSDGQTGVGKKAHRGCPQRQSILRGPVGVIPTARTNRLAAILAAFPPRRARRKPARSDTRSDCETTSLAAWQVAGCAVSPVRSFPPGPASPCKCSITSR